MARVEYRGACGVCGSSGVSWRVRRMRAMWSRGAKNCARRDVGVGDVGAVDSGVVEQRCEMLRKQCSGNSAQEQGAGKGAREMIMKNVIDL